MKPQSIEKLHTQSSAHLSLKTCGQHTRVLAFRSVRLQEAQASPRVGARLRRVRDQTIGAETRHDLGQGKSTRSFEELHR